MLSAKTKATELSVGFGVIGKDPMNTHVGQLLNLFEGTLSTGNFQIYSEEFQRGEVYYRRFHQIGLHLRHTVPQFNNVNSIRWEGPSRQAGTISIPKDLVAAGMPISVKDSSNVVGNPSPHGIFVSLPGGLPRPSRSPNWYLEVAPFEYQALYQFSREVTGLFDFPQKALDFHVQIKGKLNRKRLRERLKSLSEENLEEFNNLYVTMGHAVAERSADMFNESIKVSLGSSFRISVIEGIMRQFFRLGGNSYFLCGIDDGKEIALQVPDLTTWKTDWKMRSIQAEPAISKGQSEVKISIVLTKGRQESILPFHIEIRWSHGKFVGNPEAKLYKEFVWTQVPFFNSLHSSPQITKLSILGEGTYGVVWEAFHNRRNEKVAVKEFRVTFATTSEERTRFEREVKLMSQLDHPNILPILDADLSSRNSPWFAMPLAINNVGGIIEELKGDFDRINFIFQQTLEGMDYAHQKKVIHRDLKPENILLFSEDKVMIGDFGLGKKIDESASNITVTATDEFIGTFIYAAPEQFEASMDVDQRVDIYALGKTLLHMITGVQPLHAEHILPRVPKNHRIFIVKCIQDDPSERFQSIVEMILEFSRVVAKG